MIQMSNKKYKSLLYWANVGYGAKGKEYVSKFPLRKDPWYKINSSVLISTVGEDLSAYALKLQGIVHRGLIESNKTDTPITEETKLYHKVAGEVIGILLKGYDVLRGRGDS